MNSSFLYFRIGLIAQPRMLPLGHLVENISLPLFGNYSSYTSHSSSAADTFPVLIGDTCETQQIIEAVTCYTPTQCDLGVE